MWILSTKCSTGNTQISTTNYYEMSNEQKANILNKVLKDYDYDVYTHTVENIIAEIMIYDKEYGDFIHENGLNECNLTVFWDKYIVPILSPD